MKTCKKILAGILVFAMMMSMCAFVSADRVEHTAIPADGEKLITLWDAEYWSIPEGGSVTKDGTVWFSHFSSVSGIQKPFGLVGATTAGSTVSVVDDTLEEGNKVLKVNSNLVQANYREWFNDEKKHAMDDNNVLSFSTRLMVPSTQAEGVDKTAVTRQWTLPFQIKAFDGTTAYNASTVKVSPTAYLNVNYNDAGQLEVSASVANTASKNIYNNPMVVAEDAYFTVNLECYIIDGQKPYFCVYVNDKLIYSAIGTYVYEREVTDEETDTVTKYAWGFDLIKFNQSDFNATTYLDEIKISAHKVNTMPVYNVGSTSSADAIEGVAGNSTSLQSNIGFYSKLLQQSSMTKVDTTYSRDTTTVPGETLININTTGEGLTRVLANIREPIDEIPYMSIDETEPLYIVSSVDLYIPSGTEANQRQLYFSNASKVRAEGASDDTTFKSSSVGYYFTIKNGKLNFKPSLASDVTTKNFVEKLEEVTFPSDTLVNVKVICEVTGTEAAGFNVKAYGIVDDNLAYVSEYVYPAGEFGFSAFNIDIVNSTTSPIDTKIDNVDISLHSDYTIPAKTWNFVDYAYPTEFTVNGDAVNVKGLILGSTLEAMDVVFAFYDANGKLIAPLAKKTLTNVAGSDFEIDENADIPEGAATAKVFFLNNITSAKPLMASEKVTID